MVYRRWRCDSATRSRPKQEVSPTTGRVIRQPGDWPPAWLKAGLMKHAAWLLSPPLNPDGQRTIFQSRQSLWHITPRRYLTFASAKRAKCGRSPERSEQNIGSLYALPRGRGWPGLSWRTICLATSTICPGEAYPGVPEVALLVLPHFLRVAVQRPGE